MPNARNAAWGGDGGDGSVAIVTPDASLSLTGGAPPVGGIRFGGDVDLYRSAADVLTLTDKLEIGGALDVDGQLTIEDGTNYTDGLIYGQSKHRVFANLAAAGSAVVGSANESTLIVQTQIPSTSAAAHYQKTALMAIARTIDPSVVPTINRDCVGIHGQGYSQVTTDSRVWGGYFAGQIDSGDGQAIGVEIDLINKAAADVSTMTGTKVKNALAIVASGTQNSTCAININISAAAKWHKGLYSTAGVFTAAGKFIELASLFSVDAVDGKLTLGGDVTLHRQGAFTLESNSLIQVKRTAGDSAFNALVAGDTSSRFLVRVNGNISIGPGNSPGLQVLTARQTGWGVPTGTATRTTFATDTVTLIELARRVKALIDDLTTHGMIGA